MLWCLGLEAERRPDFAPAKARLPFESLFFDFAIWILWVTFPPAAVWSLGVIALLHDAVVGDRIAWMWHY